MPQPIGIVFDLEIAVIGKTPEEREQVKNNLTEKFLNVLYEEYPITTSGKLGHAIYQKEI